VAAASLIGSTALVGDLTPAALLETGAVAIIDQYLTVQDVANLVTDYLAPTRFGAAEWLHWFGLNVGFEPKLPRELTLFWNQPDPMDPTQLISATHLPPVLCPQFIEGQPYNLRLLGQIVQSPRNGGRASNYRYLTPALKQYQDTPAGPACWLVMKKDVGARNQPYARQIAWIQSLPGSYEATTSALHLATVVFTRHVSTGKRYLGDYNGQEGRWTYGLCQELMHFSLYNSNLLVGGFAPDGLVVTHGFGDRSCYGVVALRKF